MNSTAPQPVCLLIAALGGEGGGVLTDWIVQAATAQNLPVQSTSIPGVAQRTGATTYYIEIFPAAKPKQTPILALYPSPGGIDLMAASELLEVGRALENGYIAPDRTTLIGSTHRVFSMAEKTAMGDRRYDADSILQAARELAQRTLLFDLDKIAQEQQSALNAVLAGMIAGSGVLPLPSDALEQAIRTSGIAVESNLCGFRAGLACAKNSSEDASTSTLKAKPIASVTNVAGSEEFPASAQDIIRLGITRLIDYQDASYADVYLDRLRTLQNIDQNVLRETARYLALWMSYEDVIRVADLKTRSDRFAKIRAEVRAQDHEPLRIIEFLKPGIDEIAAILPVKLGRRVQAWGKEHQWSLRVKTHTILGFLQLRLLAKLRRWRPRSLRFQEEQTRIERWLETIRKAAAIDANLALEIALCANLNKGYSETFERGRGNFLRILDTLVDPALNSEESPSALADTIKSAREAALADPEGKTLQTVLAQAINWYPSGAKKSA